MLPKRQNFIWRAIRLWLIINLISGRNTDGAELKTPLLDLNRYAEENLPKLGLAKAKALYMFIKPGEYANYPKGKNDAAHVCDRGAFFYAKGAVEMAREQGLSLVELLKEPGSVAFVPVVLPCGEAEE